MTYSPSLFLLTHLLQKAYRRLKTFRVSTATDGTVSTVTDTKLADLLGDANEDDVLNNQTLIVIRDAGGAGAAPEGQCKRISDYVANTQTMTLESALTVAVAVGDTYMLASKAFPLFEMIEIVNDALISLGNIPIPDTSLLTENNQTEYTLPVGITRANLLSVEQQTYNAANNNIYVPINWKVIPASPGTQETLVIPPFTAGYKIRLIYKGLHPRVEDYDDPISIYVHPELAVAAVVAHCYQWSNTKTLGNSPYFLQRENKAWVDLQKAELLYPISLPQPQPKWYASQPLPHVDDITKVHL